MTDIEARFITRDLDNVPLRLCTGSTAIRRRPSFCVERSL